MLTPGPAHREATGGLMETFFGANGRQELDLRHFDEFIEALHVELVRLEYSHYDPPGQVRVVFALPKNAVAQGRATEK